jgi:hypothetical protein
MIPNIKSSEGIGDGVPEKSYTCGLKSLSCSAYFRKPIHYTLSSLQSEIVSNCLDSVTRKTTPENYKWRAASIGSVHYKERNWIFLVRL